ncbi:MAG TPA: sugar transferase, partial [Polyangia bacterium]|nr:sugar transferase [Polyangia bacterium]
MTRDESLEATALVHHAAVVVLSLAVARGAHAALAQVVPALKPPVDTRDYWHLLLAFLPIWVFIAERLGIHRIPVLTGPPTERARRVLLTQAGGLAAAALILVAAQTAFNRSLIALFFGVSTALLLATSAAERRWVAHRRGASRVLVVGETPPPIAAVEQARGRRVVWEAEPDLSSVETRLIAEPIDELLVARGTAPEKTRALVELAAALGVTALVPLADAGAVEGMPLPPPRVEAIGAAQFLVYARSGPSAAAVLVKTLCDRALAAALLIVLAPVMAAIAVAVAVRLGRPVLFLQRRAGFHGRSFRMLKFRTMRVGAEAELPGLRARNEMDGPVFKMTNDPRATPFGRFLRRSSLDELPQLFNVLAGQMSLVGPRPLSLGEADSLSGPHRRRLTMRPGMTCLWQVSGRNDLSFREWMALDLSYVDRWSLGLDLAILLRTI